MKHANSSVTVVLATMVTLAGTAGGVCAHSGGHHGWGHHGYHGRSHYAHSYGHHHHGYRHGHRGYRRGNRRGYRGYHGHHANHGHHGHGYHHHHGGPFSWLFGRRVVVHHHHGHHHHHRPRYYPEPEAKREPVKVVEEITVTRTGKGGRHTGHMRRRGNGSIGKGD